MAYDETLAERVRKALKGRKNITEKKMFGGLCLLSSDKMFCGVMQNDLMLRVGPEHAELLLKEKGIRPMDFTGKPMVGFLYASMDKVKEDAELKRLTGLALDFVATVEKKPARKKTTGKKKTTTKKKSTGKIAAKSR
ncbi:MAG: TfoX/Sxy family protein [Spirochaetales bacterium]|nr:TfoX/Sxy family protein [Spirochaetales bacterium]